MTQLHLRTAADSAVELAPRTRERDDYDPSTGVRPDDLTSEHWRFLAESGVALGQAEELSDTLRIALQLLVPRVADFAVVWLARPDRSRAMLRAAYARPELSDLLRLSSATEPIELRAEHPAWRVQQSGHVEWGAVDAQRLIEIARDAEHLAQLRALAPRSIIHVPLRERGRTLGSLLLGRAGLDSRAYCECDVALASELALRLALAIARTEERDALRTAYQERARRVATTSHDLKDPLALIETAIAFAVDEMRGPSAATDDDLSLGIVPRQLLIARRAAQRARELVVRTLDAAATDGAGLLAPMDRARSCEPARVLRELTEELSLLARARGILLAVDVANDLPAICMTAADLSRVIGNVLGNALKFTPAGGRVAVRASAVDGAVQVSIADNGRGIRAADLPNVFRPFWRGARKRTAGSAESAGSGLGLAIARELVQGAGGTIWCRSTYGAGATFRVRLPSITELQHQR